jgi:hypothetical protein
VKRKVHAKSGDVKVAKDINILGDRMDFRIVAVFCLYADVLKGLHHYENLCARRQIHK